VIAYLIISKIEKKACNCNTALTAEELEQVNNGASAPSK
jgi:hypothetical protein